MSQAFSGWSDAALDFYRRLEVDNTKAFWTEHKTVYEHEVRAPFEALSDLVADEFGSLRISRPYRDLRFSADKTPYKTNAYAVAEGEGGERYYVAITTDGLVVGSGYWMMAKDQLERYRRAVDDEAAGEDLADQVAALPGRKLQIEGQPLKTAPRGYRRDHPRVELLRLKSVAAIRSFEPAKWLQTRGAAKRITETWRAAGPVNQWLAEHVGPSTLPPPER